MLITATQAQLQAAIVENGIQYQSWGRSFNYTGLPQLLFLSYDYRASLHLRLAYSVLMKLPRNVYNTVNVLEANVLRILARKAFGIQ